MIVFPSKSKFNNQNRINPFIFFAVASFFLQGTLGDISDQYKEQKSKLNIHLSHTNGSQEAHVDLKEMDLEKQSEDDAAKLVVKKITQGVESRLRELFKKASSNECRSMIGEHFGKYINAIGTETSTPFADIFIENECDEQKYDFKNLPPGISIGTIQNRTYQPSTLEQKYIDDPSQLNLCYAILTHENSESTIRLIEALYEEGHVFVVHVDGKERSDPTQKDLEIYASSHPHVHVLPNSWRVRVNWGGYSMVEASLQTLKFAFGIDRPQNPPLKFHKFVQMASTTYPIASNTRIREKISSYPLNANLVDVVFKPIDPDFSAWHYFIECDDAVHRIYRLPPLNEQKFGGIDMYTASQWFIISREFAKYLAMSPPGSLVRKFTEYTKHVVVADETFFGTVLRNTKYCHYHHNDNFLHVQFDRWENEFEVGDLRDERKCLMPKDDHCGRSPTTLTVDYLPMLEISGDLFARKFHDEIDSHIKNIIDNQREREEETLKSGKISHLSIRKPTFDLSFEGHGVLIVAKETIDDDVPLCLGLGDSKNKVRLTPCFHDDVIDTLAPGWEYGAVVLEETLPHNRWELGPCSSDGNVVRLENGFMNVTSGLYSQTGPQCMLKQMDGLRAGRCMDGESARIQPGGEIQVFPCAKRWHQTFSFGNGKNTPKGSIHMNVPRHIQNRIKSKGKDQEPHMCIGVLSRGDGDEEEWNESHEYSSTEDEIIVGTKANEKEIEGAMPLSNWNGQQLVTTRCSNIGAIIKWIFIPFIHEDDAIYNFSTKDEETESSATKPDEEL